MLERKDLHIAANSEADEVVREATELVDNGRWHLCNDGAGVERPFTFKGFRATWVRAISSRIKTFQIRHDELTGGRIS